MKFSRDWLADHVELPEPADEIARRLTAAGHAVEGLEEVDGDLVFEVDVTTNRPDCMCHRGLARELAVVFDRQLRPVPDTLQAIAEPASGVASVRIEDYAGCPRYVALVLRGVRVGPSPHWLRRRLEAIGSRSISNLVDVTNYVLWDLGQPLHAFDLDKLAGAEIVVRRARPGETLTTLDGAQRRLEPEIQVIADRDRPTALAGIMGGLASEVTAETRNVLLEAAHFDPGTTRAGARRLGMHTDASHRFERGADPEGPLAAARRAAALMVELAGGEVLAGHLEAARLPERWPPSVEVDYRRLLDFGGVEIAQAEVERILAGLGYRLEAIGEARWRVTPPSWRWYDGEPLYPADVYEEALRIHGFDAVPAALPAIAGGDAPPTPTQLLRRRLQDRLAASGLAEAIDWAFHDREADASLPSLHGDREPVVIANPLSDRQAVMRRSLLPPLVESARFNARRGARAVRLFELGHVFAAEGDGVVEIETVAVVLGGVPGTPWEGARRLDFFDLKGIVDGVLEAEGADVRWRPAELRGLADGAAAELWLGEERLGFAGQLDDDDLPYPLFVAELGTGPLLRPRPLEVRPPSRHPAVAVDSTLTHALTVPYDDLAAAVAAARVEDLASFGLKDRYTGPGVPDGAVNTTLTFLYQSAARSLSQEEVNERHARLVAGLHSRFGLPGAAR